MEYSHVSFKPAGDKLHQHKPDTMMFLVLHHDILTRTQYEFLKKQGSVDDSHVTTPQCVAGETLQRRLSLRSSVLSSVSKTTIEYEERRLSYLR